MRTWQFFAVTGMAVTVGGIIAPAQGASVTLADLIAKTNGSNGTLVVGDKLFSNFGYTRTGDMPVAANVNVTGIGTGVGTDYYGLEFQGDFHDNVGNGGSDALIKYTVSVLNPSMRITDAHLAANLTGVGNPFTGHGSVSETFLPEVQQFLTTFNIDNSSYRLTDSYVWGLPGYTTLNVQKDILLEATSGVMTMSLVDQTFSQRAVPIPAAVWTGLSTLGGLWLLRKRRNSAT